MLQHVSKVGKPRVGSHVAGCNKGGNLHTKLALHSAGWVDFHTCLENLKNLQYGVQSSRLSR